MISTLVAVVSILPTLTLHVEGPGYLRLALDGRVVYAKAAKLTVIKGHLADIGGAELLPTFRVPDSTSILRVDGDRSLWAQTEGRVIALGPLLLAKFANDEEPSAQGAYLISKSRPILGRPGNGGFGTIVADGTSRTQEAQTSPPAKGADVASGVKGQALHVSLQAKIETDSDRVLLSEIAKIDGPDEKHAKDIDFGMLPPVGSSMRVPRERVEARLRALGLKAMDFSLDGSEVCEVSRHGQKVAQQQFIQAATDFAGMSYGNPGTWSSPDTLPDMTVPSGTVTLKAESLKTFEGGASVIVALYVDGKRLNSRTIKLTSSSPPVEGVKAGAAVKVRFLLSGITAEVDGRAKTTGFVGQSVEVLVSMVPGEPPTTHVGFVVSPGRVEVKL